MYPLSWCVSWIPRCRRSNLLSCWIDAVDAAAAAVMRVVVGNCGRQTRLGEGNKFQMYWFWILCLSLWTCRTAGKVKVVFPFWNSWISPWIFYTSVRYGEFPHFFSIYFCYTFEIQRDLNIVVPPLREVPLPLLTNLCVIPSSSTTICMLMNHLLYRCYSCSVWWLPLLSVVNSLSREEGKWRFKYRFVFKFLFWLIFISLLILKFRNNFSFCCCWC